MARRWGGTAGFLLRPRAPVRRRPAPRPRSRCGERRGGARARLGRRQLRRHGAHERQVGHDRDARRPLGDADPSRLDRRRTQRGGGRGCGRRDGGTLRHAGGGRSVCTSRHQDDRRRPGLPRPARLPAGAHAAGAGAGRTARGACAGGISCAGGIARAGRAARTGSASGRGHPARGRRSACAGRASGRGRAARSRAAAGRFAARRRTRASRERAGRSRVDRSRPERPRPDCRRADCRADRRRAGCRPAEPGSAERRHSGRRRGAFRSCSGAGRGDGRRACACGRGSACGYGRGSACGYGGRSACGYGGRSARAAGGGAVASRGRRPGALRALGPGRGVRRGAAGRGTAGRGTAGRVAVGRGAAGCRGRAGRHAATPAAARTTARACDAVGGRCDTKVRVARASRQRPSACDYGCGAPCVPGGRPGVVARLCRALVCPRLGGRRVGGRGGTGDQLG